MKYNEVPADLEKVLNSLELAYGNMEVVRSYESGYVGEQERVRKAVTKWRRAKTRYNKLLLKYLNT